MVLKIFNNFDIIMTSLKAIAHQNLYIAKTHKIMVSIERALKS